MARKRMIDPNIWQSEDFSKLDMFSRLVFIGLFSLADDEGRGRANPTYLKSSIFPYDEVVRTTDIEKSLSKISASMSIVFYEHNESKYYELYNWNSWQKIDRPSESKLPKYNEKTMPKLFDDNSTINRRTIVEGSSNDRRVLDECSSLNKNRIEVNKNKNRIRIEKENKENKKEYEEKIHFAKAEFVSMTNAEYEKLVSTYGKGFADQCIVILDNYKGSNGKKYESDYRAILSWVVDEVKKKNTNVEVKNNGNSGKYSGIDLSKNLYQPTGKHEFDDTDLI